MNSPRLLPYGDNAVLIHWEVSGFDPDVSEAVHRLAARLRAKGDFVEVMPGYDSVVASFDAASLPYASAKRRVEKALRQNSGESGKDEGRLVDIPVHYGGEFGPDLEALADAVGLTPDAVIEKHIARTYRVCMMGFIPGFTFLSEADPALHHPRHATPRAHVPGGSVGIANWQTGIYGLDSPGGWQIIGRTDIKLFDKDRESPFYVAAGDRVRFVPA
jgi:KipI family sensor histidine kinase inhibitor